LAGILPLSSERHAEYLHNEVPGIQIPDSVRRRISNAGPLAQAEGQRAALEVIESVAGIAQGIYLMLPFGRYDLAAALIETVRARLPSVVPSPR
jgi:homocysteine S-methyltransferase